MKPRPLPRVKTGIPNLDAILGGGLPKGSVSIVGGAPGAGKTIFAQQICFSVATDKERALYFGTLSEPTAKTLRYISQFSFFRASAVEHAVELVDLGIILRTKGLAECAALLMAHVKRVKPAVVVIDSFKVFEELARTTEKLRKFGYELAVQLMAWQSTALIIGEYGPRDATKNPIFSVVDGLITMNHKERFGEQRRYLRVAKMRGTDHSRDEHPFAISRDGIEIHAPRLTIVRAERPQAQPRCKTGIERLDDLLGQGIPRGSTVLVAGAAGTGKTVLLLEFLYRGALAGERGILFSFEETADSLRAAGASFGWDIEREMRRGMLEIVCVPSPEIRLEADLELIQTRTRSLGASRVAIDSLSVFLHKVDEAQTSREKTFQLATIVQSAGAVGLFASDIPYGSTQISRFGAEETVADGVILLSSVEEGLDRERYIEVYKLRDTAHATGKFPMVIGESGISMSPRAPRPTEQPEGTAARSLSSGVEGLDAKLSGGLLERSVTLVSGAAGVGKTTFGLQFLARGAASGEAGLLVTLEQNEGEVRAWARSLGLARDAVSLLSFVGERLRPLRFLETVHATVRASGVQRVVIDGLARLLATEGALEGTEVLGTLLQGFKAAGVTSMLTLESPSLRSAATATGRELSYLADNIIHLRYAKGLSRLDPVLTVIKTRGTAHDLGTHPIAMTPRGIEVQSGVTARTPARSSPPVGGR